MTFNTYETSIDQGEPILLFDFAIGIEHFRYTTADRAIVYQTNSFAPVPIKRSNPVKSSDVKRQIMTVTAPRDIGVAQVFSVFAPGSDMLLTITALHYTDPDQQGIVDWIGRVTGPTWKGESVELACEPVYTSVQTTGLRRRWSINCPHVLYGAGCTLSAGAFKVTGTIGALSGLVATVGAAASPPAGLSYLGGWLEWDTGQGYLERRTIENVNGAQLTLQYGSPQLAVGLAVSLYPGCNRTINNCNAFGNVVNFGGAPYIPNKNPMDGLGTPIY